ncbi:ComF family protein [Bacillus sp. REN3]|uniref:ComF family protein n=1 Tax=Bacillus sp. REN3 TaxID=2802440 RepID=UPI0032C1E54D
MLCHEELEPDISWGSLFGKAEPANVCEDCLARFPLITGETCVKCGRPFAFLEDGFRSGDMCVDCKRWEDDKAWTGTLDKNIALYRYDDFIKEVIAKYKFRGDYVLARIFAEDIRKALQAFQYDDLVPIPLSEERLYERGFNQAEGIIREAGFEPFRAMSRVHSEKQSKKSRQERIHLSQIFNMEKAVESKTILLVDDIYTTGSTLRHAAKILKEHGAVKVYSLTLAR